METLASEKKALRATMRQRLDAIPVGRRTDAERRACSRFQSSVYFACARSIMLYAPTDDEFDIAPALLGALASDRVVCLPRVDWDRGTMTPCVISAYPGGLVIGRHGIPQPPPDARPVHPSDLDLVVAPAIAFDLRAGRLGRGAGFYDRFLADPHFTGLAVGVAIEEQIVEQVPMRTDADFPDEHMDAVITDRRMILGSGRPRSSTA